MSWATPYIAAVRAGQTVSFRPTGGSMVGRIASGDLCTVVPLVAGTPLHVDDVVLCTVGGHDYLHLIKAISAAGYQIGNNRGGVNGWITRELIHGKCVRVEGR